MTNINMKTLQLFIKTGFSEEAAVFIPSCDTTVYRSWASCSHLCA